MMKEIYVIIYVKPNIAKKIIKKDSYGCNKFNYEMFNIKSYNCPMVDIYDDEDYYTFTIYEDSIDFGGLVAYKILEYAKGNAYCTVGYEENTYKYKYSYKDDGLYVDGYTKNSMEFKTLNLISKFTSLEDYLSEYVILSDDELCEEKLENIFESHNADYDSIRKIKDLVNDKNAFTIEWLFIEDYLKIMEIAIKKSPIKDTPLIFRTEYIEEPKESVSIFNTLFKSNKPKEKTLSWEDEKFEKEAKLWGLTEADKKRAKEERMSPSDFIEAEERDDDELIIDEWE